MSEKNSPLSSFFALIVFGSIFLFAGVTIVLVSIDVIHVPEEGFNAPRWVVTAAGLTFALAGVMIMNNGLKEIINGNRTMFKWINNGLAITFTLALAIPFHWVAFGPGEREFSQSVGIGPVSIGKGGGELGGRIAFGAFAILMDVLILFVISRMITGQKDDA